jgi:hypothetical protein
MFNYAMSLGSIPHPLDAVKIHNIIFRGQVAHSVIEERWDHYVDAYRSNLIGKFDLARREHFVERISKTERGWWDRSRIYTGREQGDLYLLWLCRTRYPRFHVASLESNFHNMCKAADFVMRSKPTPLPGEINDKKLLLC